MKHPTVQLAKMLSYILGRRPDEFGLVTDSQGFVKIKDLLKALGEEKGFRHVRRGHLDEIVITLSDPPIEIRESRVRAKDRANLSPTGVPDSFPKLLYTCVRRKAYSVVLEKGVMPGSHPMVVLSSDQDMASRIGKRSDGSPVLLTVSVDQARTAGARFLSAGGTLYLSEFIPSSCFSGPPLRRMPEEAPSREPRPAPPAPKQPGSFFPDPAEIFDREGGGNKDRRGKRPEWKRDRKRMQRMERKKGPRF